MVFFNFASGFSATAANQMVWYRWYRWYRRFRFSKFWLEKKEKVFKFNFRYSVIFIRFHQNEQGYVLKWKFPVSNNFLILKKNFSFKLVLCEHRRIFHCNMKSSFMSSVSSNTGSLNDIFFLSWWPHSLRKAFELCFHCIFNF